MWKNKIKKLMNPFKHNVIYKRWLINDLSLDCDVINTLKHTITKLMLTRTFKPPKTKEVENNINKTYFYNDQGVRFKIIKHIKHQKNFKVFISNILPEAMIVFYLLNLIQ